MRSTTAARADKRRISADIDTAIGAALPHLGVAAERLRSGARKSLKTASLTLALREALAFIKRRLAEQAE